ncbi:alpha/beta hydrolase [Curtobacterium sp. VKM Ac-1393]|uniref:alpha/beta hydrolase n=1 Tax=Curtobacterium sp. VKM Ac-1393 TaxID=2783814 RepID=UPI00188C1CC3|nr:alpha/beta hydrolase fold domain-containing protein [Curtobacterium sp. VKM Ac-1393]MBF4607687.1 alpha/beta hydrolase fold domain-containing protein [Curtobacterium sp. VKM Ac-1393]
MRGTPSVTITGGRVEGPDGPVPIRHYRLADDDGVPTLVWLHGGGFFRGSLDQAESDAVARALAARGVPVVAVDYRLGPLPGMPWIGRTGPRARRRAPHARDEVAAVLHHLADATPAGLVLGGASAGACLAATAVRDAPPVVGAVFAYGFFHGRLPHDPGVQRLVRGHRRLTHAPLLLDAANRTYAGPLGDGAFPAPEDLGAFPRTLMIDAELDTMRSSGDRFARQLGAAGVAVERHVLPESRHAFLNRPGSSDFAAAVDLIASWVVRRPD